VSRGRGGINVVGVGEAGAPPDIMLIDIGVSIRADTVAEASTGARESAATLMETLTGAGVAKGDLATTGYTVYPEYDHRDGEQRLLGYRVSNELRITLRDLEGAGEILDRGMAAAGDAVMVNRLLFAVEDETGPRDQAREAAWRDALARAEHLARLAGRSLGPAVSIDESPGLAPGPRPLARMAAMAESATPIEPGTATVKVTLQVRFELA